MRQVQLIVVDGAPANILVSYHHLHSAVSGSNFAGSRPGKLRIHSAACHHV